jgi:geranylgeranyl pyrophosphate synthase
MKIYAQKTSPAFEAAIYAGLRAAGATGESDALRSFATYLGEGFQIRNDLDDWREDGENNRKKGLDAMAGRPTLLHAFAVESGKAAALAELAERRDRLSEEKWLEELRRIYASAGAFEKVDGLYRKLRDRALRAAEEFSTPDLRELMQSLARLVLHETTTLRDNMNASE